MKNSLSTTGLSLSQAISISNILNQRCVEIQREIDSFNICSKTIEINNKTHELQKSIPVYGIKNLIVSKAQFHAIQAFLMENIKAKENLLNEIKSKTLPYPKEPEIPAYLMYTPTNVVGETWGWNQLSKEETEEYIEAEALAAHIGQLIHKEGKLTKLRKELSQLPAIEWMEIKKDEKVPILIKTNTSSTELLNLHEDLSKLHRTYESRVNYFKAKVKNLITEENARIAKENAIALQEVNSLNDKLKEVYSNALAKIKEEHEVKHFEFQNQIEKEVKEASKLRIQIPERFKAVIDAIISKE